PRVRANCAALAPSTAPGKFMLIVANAKLPSSSRTHLLTDGLRPDRPYAMLVLSMVESDIMETTRKITVEVPIELLEKAQRASGTGITQTVRTGLRLLAASRTYDRLRQLRGAVRFTRTLAELKADR
ncbi:MAG: hypothetical protein ACLQVL_20860, partial [Terriglobia bacterium]